MCSRCCCDPYPSVDITCAFTKDSADEQLKRKVQVQAVEACQNFGCFHVTIDPSKVGPSDLENVQLLQDESQVKQAMEKIFHEDFLDSHTGGEQIKVVPFRNRHKTMSYAKYRGRAAESGSSSNTEPKQSWEIFRCKNGISGDSSSETDSGDLSLLEEYTNIFHQVSLCLFQNVFQLPNIFIEETDCTCGKSDCSLCTMDLLRVFRYDALEKGEIMNSLGSSPHTDWGSLTVVWQDSKGGLQIYCHKHETWNNVNLKLDDDKKVKLFIHVGDFTSLALSDIHNSSISWPSPLHRVLCPTRSDTLTKDSDDTRLSLVYFSYPKRGVSIQDASQSKETSESMTTSNDFPFDRYMVLHNQSINEKVSPSAKDTYERVKSMPFDKVTEEKWKQVQR